MFGVSCGERYGIAGFFCIMTNIKFIHLHTHSYYSLLDGAISLSELVSTASKLGMRALALTDHGNLLGAIEFYNKAMGAGVKPIIGVELYLAPTNIEIKDRENYHIVLLARDNLGYKNLLRLVSIAHLKGFYYKPRIDKHILGQYSKGLIGLSSCLKGEIPSFLANDDYERARNSLKEYLSIFEDGNFYLEIQKHNIPEEEKINKGIFELSKEVGVPVVATNDVHYLKKEDAYAHDVLLCVQTLKKINDEDRLKMRGENYHFRTPEEMAVEFKDTPDVLQRTVEIAEKCSVFLELGKYYMPRFEIPDEYKSDFEFLKNRVQEKLIKLFDGSPPQSYQERLDHELEVIRKMGFSSYFLIVADFINYAKSRNIGVGPGRGSAAGSLISYLLGITEVDPLRFNLIFERFLNEERISRPDIDTDVEDIHRKDVINYLTEFYGAEHVAAICTFIRMMTRRVIRDVGRVLDIPLDLIDKVLMYLPENVDLANYDIKTNKQLSDLVENEPRLNKLFELSKRFVGFPRNVSTHAAGVVISPREYKLVELVPLMLGKNNEVITQYDMDSVEQIGLLKIDVLGNSNLTVISKTTELIFQRHKKKVELKKISFEDQKTLELFRNADTNGIFQLDEPGMQNLMRELEIDKFEDLVHLLALYRPGPLQSGLVKEFINRKKGLSNITYIHPLLKNILQETYGVILYQEQVMQIANQMAGFSMSKADELRKAMGKKVPEIMDSLRDEFVRGAVNNGVSENVANKVFEQISYFAGYGFNKAHSVAYAIVAYRAGYLKAHYFLEYWVSVLNYTVEHKSDNLLKHIKEAENRGVKVLGPDVNKSDTYFSIDKGNIRFGLGAIKNIGYGLAQEIVRNRQEHGPFKDLFDFVKRMRNVRITARMVDSLVKAGAFDFTRKSRAQLIANIENAFKASEYYEKTEVTGQTSLFDGMDVAPVVEEIKAEEWPDEVKYEFEREMLGIVLSGDPLKQYLLVYRFFDISSIASIKEKNIRHSFIAGILHNIVYKTSLSKNKIARALVTDSDGVGEVIFNQEQFSKLKEGRFFIMEVALAEHETSSGRALFFCRNIWDLDEFIRFRTSELSIVFKKQIDKSNLQKLHNILARYPGSVAVLLKIITSDNTEVTIRSESIKVNPNFALLRDLATLPFIIVKVSN